MVNVIPGNGIPSNPIANALGTPTANAARRRVELRHLIDNVDREGLRRHGGDAVIRDDEEAELPELRGNAKIVAVPSPSSWKCNPVGSVIGFPERSTALMVMAGPPLGKPVVVTVKVLGSPWLNRTADWLVIVGGVFTTSVNVCMVTEPAPLLAEIVSVNDPPASIAGVPENVPVPLPLSVKRRPEGRPPLTPSVIGPDGMALAVVTVKELACPRTNVAWWRW